MVLFRLLVGLLALRGAAEGAGGQQQQQQQQGVVDVQYGEAGMSDLMRGILQATNEGDDKLATELREKLDALRQVPVEEAGATPWVTECEANAALTAEIFAISDPTVPADIRRAMDYLDEFWKTDKGEDLPYPGDFDKFMHEDGFRILRINYNQLPAGVRQWREEQLAANTMERKFIAVLDCVAYFPPGVMTFLLPLFATQDVVAGQDACRDSLGDLIHYHQAREDADPNTIFRYQYDERIQIRSIIMIQTTAKKRSRRAEPAKSGKDEL